MVQLQIWGKNLDTKKEIRKQILKLRSEMSLIDWAKRSEIICQKVITSHWFREATDLYCYMDFKNEVCTRKIMEEAMILGKNIWIPKVEGEEMNFYLTTSFDELKPHAYGILEPDGTTACAEGNEGLMIIPGVAFDREKNRIGYGKGYYDRYLEKHPDLITMAICFDIQMMEKIPKDDHDKALDVLMTESLTIGGE